MVLQSTLDSFLFRISALCNSPRCLNTIMLGVAGVMCILWGLPAKTSFDIQSSCCNLKMVLMSAWHFYVWELAGIMQLTGKSRRVKNVKGFTFSRTIVLKWIVRQIEQLCVEMLNWVVIRDCTEEQNTQLGPLSGVTKLNWTLYWIAIHLSFKLN